MLYKVYKVHKPVTRHLASPGVISKLGAPPSAGICQYTPTATSERPKMTHMSAPQVTSGFFVFTLIQLTRSSINIAYHKTASSRRSADQQKPSHAEIPCWQISGRHPQLSDRIPVDDYWRAFRMLEATWPTTGKYGQPSYSFLAALYIYIHIYVYFYIYRIICIEFCTYIYIYHCKTI